LPAFFFFIQAGSFDSFSEADESRFLSPFTALSELVFSLAAEAADGEEDAVILFIGMGLATSFFASFLATGLTLLYSTGGAGLNAADDGGDFFGSSCWLKNI